VYARELSVIFGQLEDFALDLGIVQQISANMDFEKHFPAQALAKQLGVRPWELCVVLNEAG
jgi:hypothetical protein